MDQHPMDDDLLDSFLCPITGATFVNPVVTRDGHTYERDAIQGWFHLGHRTSPLTNLELTSRALIPNHTLLKAIVEEASRKRKREEEAESAMSNLEAHFARMIQAWSETDASRWLIKVRERRGWD